MAHMQLPIVPARRVEPTTEPLRACTTCLHIFAHPATLPCRTCTRLQVADAMCAEAWRVNPTTDHWEPIA